MLIKASNPAIELPIKLNKGEKLYWGDISEGDMYFNVKKLK